MQITEGKMLLIAFGLMVALSSLVGGALYICGAAPIAVVVGATASGVLSYVLVCLYSAPFVIKPVIEEEHDGA
jgi:hypothetical protein